MMTKIHGRIFFECDECGELLETKCADFEASRLVLDDAGWRAKKVGEKWEHVCDECDR